MPPTAKIVEIDSVPMDGLGIPVRSIKIPHEGRSVFVFTMSRTARLNMSPERFHETAQALGDLIHPSSAMLVVLPDGEELSAYEVTE